MFYSHKLSLSTTLGCNIDCDTQCFWKICNFNLYFPFDSKLLNCFQIFQLGLPPNPRPDFIINFQLYQILFCYFYSLESIESFFVARHIVDVHQSCKDIFSYHIEVDKTLRTISLRTCLSVLHFHLFSCYSLQQRYTFCPPLTRALF